MGCGVFLVAVSGVCWTGLCPVPFSSFLTDLFGLHYVSELLKIRSRLWYEGKVKREEGTRLGDYTANYGSSAGSQSAIERISSLLSKVQQIKVETERFGGAAAERDAEMNGWKWGQCHAVSFTMQGWEGISLAYITLSPPSPPLTSPSPPPTHTHTYTHSPPSLLRSQDVALAYLLFQCFGYLPLFCSPSSQKAGGGRKWGDHKDERWWRVRGARNQKRDGGNRARGL